MMPPSTLPLDHPSAFNWLMVDEGGELDLSTSDPGNYTPSGTLTGSRWGISSLTYPDVNKQTLTRDGAAAIYLRDYWTPYRCSDLPASVRYLVYTCIVNSGGAGAEWLQTAIMAQTSLQGGADGNIGNHTVAAAALCDAGQLIVEMTAQRLIFLTPTAIYAGDRTGLSRRIARDLWIASLPPSSNGVVA